MVAWSFNEDFQFCLLDNVEIILNVWWPREDIIHYCVLQVLFCMNLCDNRVEYYVKGDVFGSSWQVVDLC